VFNNGIDLEKFKYNEQVRKEYRKKLRLENKFVIGHIGRFNMQKNHHFLLQVFNELQKKRSNSILLLIGDGELKEDIIREVEQMGLKDKVRFLGVRKDTRELYQAMDIFLLPSFFEGFPVLAVESLDEELPIIDYTNISEMLKFTQIVKST